MSKRSTGGDESATSIHGEFDCDDRNLSEQALTVQARILGQSGKILHSSPPGHGMAPARFFRGVRRVQETYRRLVAITMIMMLETGKLQTAWRRVVHA